jgi:hypothetical protein
VLDSLAVVLMVLTHPFNLADVYYQLQVEVKEDVMDTRELLLDLERQQLTQAVQVEVEVGGIQVQLIPLLQVQEI